METIFFEKPIVLSNEETLILESTYLQNGTGTVATHAYWREQLIPSGEIFDPTRHPVLEHYQPPYFSFCSCSYCNRKNPYDADECKGCGAPL